MPLRKPQKIAIAITLAVMGICVLVIAGTYLIELKKPGSPGLAGAFNSGGDFTLMGDNGKIFHLSDCRGKVVLLFFGYTSCPNACPATLAKLSRAFALLGADRDKVTTLFVTVDPQRDTPAKLKEYLTYFGINGVGLTGTKAQIDAVVDAYHAFYLKVPSKSAMGYSINHTTTVYLIDQQGKVQHLFQPLESAKNVAGIIRKFI